MQHSFRDVPGDGRVPSQIKVSLEERVKAIHGIIYRKGEFGPAVHVGRWSHEEVAQFKADLLATIEALQQEAKRYAELYMDRCEKWSELRAKLEEAP